MNDKHVCELHNDGQDVFIVVDGVRIAKRRSQASGSAINWIMLEPGWIIRDVERSNAIEVRYEGATITDREAGPTSPNFLVPRNEEAAKTGISIGRVVFEMLPLKASCAKPRQHHQSMIRKMKDAPMAKSMSKAGLIDMIVEKHPAEITRKDVKGVIEAVAEIGHKELKKTGVFLVPGLAKFVVIKKPATKARKGINPFTKEPTIFKAKPARKIIRARPVKAAKDAVA